jgi:hypothetical protein
MGTEATMNLSDITSAFELDARAEFAFLINDFRFDVQPIEVHPPDIWVTWQRTTVEVTVDLEWGSGLSVIIATRSRITSRITRRVGLHQLIAQVAPTLVLPRVAILEYDVDVVRKALHANATALKTYGSRLLVGDFSQLL